jgi:hypothetical protein
MGRQGAENGKTILTEALSSIQGKNSIGSNGRGKDTG